MDLRRVFDLFARPKELRSVKSLRNLRDDNTVAGTFQPPPLFQAYPQSLRHTVLESPDEEQRPKRFKRKQKTGQKIYILTTSGYLLQYPGAGEFDRLPDQCLLLGPDSAAFASDMIEGKHWVLQVEDGDQKRPMLLVFPSPESMEVWMHVIRTHINSTKPTFPIRTSSINHRHSIQNLYKPRRMDPISEHRLATYTRRASFAPPGEATRRSVVSPVSSRNSIATSPISSTSTSSFKVPVRPATLPPPTAPPTGPLPLPPIHP